MANFSCSNTIQRHVTEESNISQISKAVFSQRSGVFSSDNIKMQLIMHFITKNSMKMSDLKVNVSSKIISIFSKPQFIFCLHC